MPVAVRAPSGRDIWKAVRDELMLNLYPLPFSTLAPTVYHVYLHPEDFATIEPIAPRIVAQIERALSAEVGSLNAGIARSARRVLSRLLKREDLPPIEAPASGWEVHLQPDSNGEIDRGHLGIVSTLAMPPKVEYGGTPTTRIVKSVVGRGQRTSTTTDVPLPPSVAQAVVAPPALAPMASASSTGSGGELRELARLSYEDETGPHVFVMRKDTISVGRGGSAAWVDVQVAAGPKVSREHFRIRRDPSGDFYIQDVSLWGTTVDGRPIPPSAKAPEGVAGPGEEQKLPPRAQIGLADSIVIAFDAIPAR